MVVEVDDAGWGDLIGGAVIVLRRLESDERFTGEIPLSAFQGSAFSEKQYLVEAIRIVREGISTLKINKDEELRVCTGYILSGVRAGLVNEGFTMKPFRIVGKTQEFAETEFVKSLVRLGVGALTEVKSMRSYKGFLKWILADLENRERYVKTGWASWSKLRSRAD